MGKSKELAELGDVVTQSGGNVGIGISTVVAPLHVGTEGTHGITAWFGDESSFVDNASYHYTDARVGISGRDSDNTDHGAGIEFTSRNTGSSNWLHGYLVHNRDGAFAFGTGGAGTSSAPERMRIDASGRVTMPYQPSFFARPQSGYSFTAAADQTIGGTWSVQSNVGNHFNASGGAFTAPVQGVYAFSWAVFITGNLTTRQDAYILVNGSPRIRVEINAYSAGTQNRSQHAHGSIRLAANDVVTFGAYATVSSGQPSIYTTTAPWSYASGALIG